MQENSSKKSQINFGDWEIVINFATANGKRFFIAPQAEKIEIASLAQLVRARDL